MVQTEYDIEPDLISDPAPNVGVRVGDLWETGPDACMPSILGNLHIQMATTRGFSLARSDSYFFSPCSVVWGMLAC
jgi:hypothetical protein